MPFAKLVIIQPGHPSRELNIESELVTFGRALDNVIALEDDSNVSRYHAEIELRGETFWLTDLRSRNGTTVNDQPIDLERQLENGDLICFGGSTTVEFQVSDFPQETRETPAHEVPVPNIPSASPQISTPVSGLASNVAAPGVPAQIPAVTSPALSLSPLYVGGAIIGGLVITAVVGAILYFSSSRGCNATVRVVSPQSGTTLKEAISIRVEAENTECIDRLIYQLDGVKVASSEIAPYQATLDPADISGLTPGNHVLTVVVEDDKGNRTVQPDEVVLGFEAPRKPSDDVTETASPSPDGNTRQNDLQSQGVSAADIKQMCEKLIRQLSSNREYVLSRELLHQIQARTSDYATPGFYLRARPFRDVINDSFVNEQGLEKPLGYILAMSRSNFDLSGNRNRPSANADGEGLWKIQLSLAQDAGYIGRCGTTTLSDQNQKCAAMVAAAYMKALQVDLFGGDPLYAVACFSMTPKDAAQWRDQLPADRRDLWNVVKTTEHRERLVRFFAAGIVGENPAQFGLVNDFPLSNLYPR